MSDYPTRLLDIGIKLLSNFTLAKSKHQMQCTICNHIWSSTPISKLQSHRKYGTNGCPQCNVARTSASLDVINEKHVRHVESLGFNILTPYNGYKQPITIHNPSPKCGHTWQSTPERIIGANANCPTCNNVIKRDRFKQFNKHRQDVFKQNACEWKLYRSRVNQLTSITYDNHKDAINPHNHPRGVAGVDGAYQLDHIIPARLCFDYGVPAELCADVTNLQIIPWLKNLSKKHKIQLGYIPKVLQEYVTSNYHTGQLLQRLIVVLERLNVEYDVDSNVVHPYRVHIYIPQCNVAIRVYDVNIECQQYTQSTRVLANSRHQAQKKGINLIQIFSDEWVNNEQLVLSKLIHICGLSNLPSIHARKCAVKLIGNVEKNEFLNKFHIQGTDKSQINIGAYHPGDPDRLVAVMTFCRPRVIMGQKAKPPGMWELSRFATDINVRIPGIGSRLMSLFKRTTEDWTFIYSYADARWSVGNAYDRMGFALAKHAPPSYWYVVRGNRKHRWGYRKDAIRDTFPDVYDVNKTEYQMMLECGIDRIWDAGTLLWTMRSEMVPD